MLKPAFVLSGFAVILSVFAFFINPAVATTASTATWTTQADFDAGEKVNVDTESSPGDVQLASYESESIDFNRRTISKGTGTRFVAIKNDGIDTAGLGWTNLKAVACSKNAYGSGRWMILGLKDDGKVLARGYRSSGLYNIELPWENIKGVAAGTGVAFGVTSEGSVVKHDLGCESDFGWSISSFESWTNIKSVAVSGCSVVFGIRKDGKVLTNAEEGHPFKEVENWENVKAIGASLGVVVGLKGDGTAVAVAAGNTNLPTTTFTNPDWTDIIDVTASSSFIQRDNIWILKRNGTVIGIGSNHHGQVSGVSSWEGITEITGEYEAVIGLKPDGTLVGAGFLKHETYWELNLSSFRDIRQPSYDSGYLTSGILTSSVLDTEQSSNFENLSWNATIPAEAGVNAVKFQIASNNDNATWNFVGPDGSPDTYYLEPGPVWSGHSGDRYLRYKVYFSTANGQYTPILHDVTINYRPYDITPPEITVLSPEQRDYQISEDLTVNYIVTDDLSGVASSTATLDGQSVENGQIIDLFNLPLGQHIFKVAATDNAGNTASKEVIFNTVATPESTISIIEELLLSGEITSSGIANSLTSRLENALSSIANDNTNAAIGQLNAFINQVNAQADKKIDSDAAILLIQAAQNIIDNPRQSP